MDDFVLGIDFGGSKTALATADSAGHVLARTSIEVGPRHPAEQTLANALRAARDLVGAAVGETGGRCRAVGVATPGIAGEGGIALSPNLPGWDGICLGDELGAAFGVEAVVDNDVKCAARAEYRWGALAGADPAVYVNLGTGVACAAVVGGRVVEGAHGGAGEIGYARFWTPEHAAKANLEELVGGRGLIERAGELDGHTPTAEELFAAPVGSAMHALVEVALEGLAAQLQTVLLVLDPERVAIGGGLMAQHRRILAAMGRAIEVPRPLGASIVPARFVHDAPLRGALALVLPDGVGDAELAEREGGE